MKMRPPVSRAIRSGREIKTSEDAERAIKIKTECLKLTLQGLQKMLEAEKRKLERERGEVEGLARRQGLVLVDPSVVSQPPHPQTPRGEMEDETREEIETSKRHNTDIIEWRQGDCLTGSEEYLKYDGMHKSSGLTDHMSWQNDDVDIYGTNGVQVWMKQASQHGDGEENFWSKQEFNDPFTDCIFKDVQSLEGDGAFGNGSYLTDSGYSSRRLKPPLSEASDKMHSSLTLEDVDMNASNHHLAVLISEVEHITKAIEELQSC